MTVTPNPCLLARPHAFDKEPFFEAPTNILADLRPNTQQGKGGQGERLTGIGSYHVWGDEDEEAFIASPGKGMWGAHIWG